METMAAGLSRILGAYWESQDEYENKLQPKDTVPLLHITDVAQIQTTVAVMYEDPKHQVSNRLDLTFDTDNRDSEWNRALCDLRSADLAVAQ